MECLIGYPLSKAIEYIQSKHHTIIQIVKIYGYNNKFNKLHNPYVIRSNGDDDKVTLFVAYY